MGSESNMLNEERAALILEKLALPRYVMNMIDKMGVEAAAKHFGGEMGARIRAHRGGGSITEGMAHRAGSRNLYGKAVPRHGQSPAQIKAMMRATPNLKGTGGLSAGQKASNWFRDNKKTLGNIGMGAGGAAALGGLAYGAKRLMRKAPSNLGRNAGIAALLAGGGLGGYALSKQSSYAELEAWLQPGTCAK